MGCGASSKTGGEDDKALGPAGAGSSIIVWGAEGLKEAEGLGGLDPYCVVRVGDKGSKWGEKIRGAGRRSEAVKDTANPKWNLGLAVDAKGFKDPEVHVRIFDKDFFTEDDYIGEVVSSLAEISGKGSSAPVKIPITGGAKPTDGRSLSINAGPTKMLEDLKVSASGFYEKIAGIGEEKSVKVDDIKADGPIRVGVGPGLPASLQGVYWLTEQGKSSALASFGGPSGCGGGCSIGQLDEKNRYKVRVAGDRVWAYAKTKEVGGLASSIDLVYHFVFNDAKNPTKCQIYPESRKLNFTLPEWVMDFEMELMKDGDPRYPGSVVWRRISSILGKEAKSAEYLLAQVMDAKGQRIEPAWSEFVKYQNSPEAGDSPGVVWYREAKA